MAKWSEILPQETLCLATELEAHAQEERDNGKVLYPPQEQIFRALQLTEPENVRVCLVGQDPYHTPGQANSCVRWGWDKFTKSVLQAATQLPQPVVFLLWGSNAQDLISCAAIYEDGKHIVRENLIKKAYVLSSHPSPFSATRPCRGTPAFRGSKPFSTTNQLLVDMGGTPIDWSL